jgi:hypothetical protein
MHRTASLLLLLFAPLALLSQAPSTDAVKQERKVVPEVYQGGWNATSAAPAPTGTVDLNDLRAVRNQALVEGRGTLSAARINELEALYERLRAQDPQGQDTELAAYHLYFPEERAFAAARRAVALNAERAEVIAPSLALAHRIGDSAGKERWGKALFERGGLAPGLVEAGRDLLASVDRDGILVAAGEMDAYACWALQAAKGERTDVLVVDRRMLEDGTYRRQVWSAAGGQGAMPQSGQALMEALATASRRPLHLSLALARQVPGAWSGQLYVVGTVFRYSAVPLDNIPLLEVRWTGFRKPMNAGPLSHNYLVLAAVLLKHYRAQDDEAGIARMERTLRTMADKLGATSELYRNGVLQH